MLFKSKWTAGVTAALMCACTAPQNDEVKLGKIDVNYPETNKTEVVDNYFGKEVNDPYRWLEDDRSEETGKWVEEQNKVTFDYLSKIPFRDKVRERLEQVWNYPKHSAPFKRGGRYYFYKNDGLQNQSVLYVKETLDGEAQAFFDPNKLSEDGTVALSSSAFSKDGKYFAYAISRSGSDWKEIYVKNVETGEQLKDEVKWVKFSGISWQGDGFYYSAYDAPEEGTEYSGKNEFHKVYFHKLGTEQSADELVWEDKAHALRNFYAYTTDDEQLLVVSGSEGTSGNMLMVKPAGASSFITVVDGFDSDHHVVDNVEGGFLLQTNYEAPNNRLVKVSFENPAPDQWVDVIAESDRLLQGTSVIGAYLFANYLEDAYSKVYRYALEGTEETPVELPGIGSVGGFGGDKEDTELFYTYTSFINPSTIYRYDVTANKSEVYKASEIDFDVTQFETKQVFYESKDGTKVPMFITFKKGTELDGTNPTYLYSYGGFDISMTPRFSTAMLVWLEQGGIYAQPSIRGGGEYGQKWHEGGMLHNKQNVFDDFIAAAEYLIDEGYTSKGKLAIAGGSNGGLLVGACMTQRPDLYQVCFPAVGVMDMLRYHKFTIGWAWAVEYGSSEDSTHFDNLYSYSPLHNLKKDTCYPATMVTTADHDDRVVPAHSFKFAATLQDAQGCEKPTLIRIETKAGHGAGKPTSKVIQEYADKFAFAWYNMGVEPVYQAEEAVSAVK
ncbi:prolyl oligopeptidase family serine peptidase [Limibacter armeniacum]|uniref:prolyl oligopeptidase family serine peptidase n=1 Tax=Limibacter armeniacum TaxID=466084 RepID=UPI002FE4FDB1